jgi:threonylcarbamoyladenosine tRNA methylthiotransferase MtaB
VNEVVTFGCRLNACESETIRRHAAAAHLDNVVVVNSCAVTAEAERQARQTIRRIKRERPAMRIIVTGCAAEVNPASFAAMAEVDRVIGNDAKMSREAWIEAGAALAPTTDGGLGCGKIAVNDTPSTAPSGASPIDRISGRTRAYVQVQNGCDHRCTFCIIPFGRGNSRSLAIADVIEQVRRLVANGTREVVLTGVDLTSYGADLPFPAKLGTLVSQLLKEVGALARLRLSSLDCIEIDRELLAAIAEEERLMPHLHLSLQGGDDLVLKRMKRRHTRREAIALCERLRRLRPDIVFGADLIAGFPTETEEMFRSSLDLIDECGLTQLHVFPYSQRPGTPAVRMPQIERSVIKERAARLRQHGEMALRRHLDAEIGAVRQVLAESRNGGYSEHFIPVAFALPVEPGAIMAARVAGHDGSRLLATPAGP